MGFASIIMELETVNRVLEIILKVPHVEKLLAIKGVGVVTVTGFIAEVVI